jgi:hypothetical protein
LSATEFRLRAEQMIVELVRDGHDGFMLMDHDGKPVGFMTVWLVNHPAQTPQFHPHADWFTWATPRNKLECALHFTLEMKKDRLGILIAEPENWRLFQHLCKYGAVRRVGTFRGYWADGRDGLVFETVR